ncbi:hypothetical protein Q9233_002821 [Columba guinea]|nr:hypothetical protein Q9233_002821 [Columba guinea]
MPQFPPVQCPAVLPDEQAGPSCAPTPCKRKRQVSENEVCRLCQRADCDPDVVGRLCHQDGLCVHENCLYHASGLEQRGADDEGFYGFLFSDIQQKLKQVAQKGQALRSALHHFRCPLCQDMVTFQEEMFRLGINIPNRPVPSSLASLSSVMLWLISSCIAGCYWGVPTRG